MSLPPPPTTNKLMLEESEASVQITWHVPAGEWKRKLMVYVLIFGLLQQGYILFWVLRTPYPWLYYLVMLVGVLAITKLVRYLLALSRGRGDGLLELFPDRLHYESGSGTMILDLRRGDCRATGLWRNGQVSLYLKRSRDALWRYVLTGPLGYLPYTMGVRIHPPSRTEGAWIRDVLERWRSGTLFPG